MEHTAFELTSGGIIGRDHRERCANYQDGAYITRGPAGTVGIITDGCGSGAHSEVGAQFGARLVGEATRRELERHGLTALDWQRLRHDVLSELHGRVSAMGGSFRQTVNDYFLFTVVGVILAGDLALFFALGDGVIIVNGEVTALGPWPGNQPPYLGYGLLGGSVTSLPPDQLEFQVVRSLPLDRLNHFLLGSDGVSDLI
ncbi:MAG TPA: protein phosphatase 2C domain-containing protein, partial [Candidatus Saccharimonas sp.]|nr:protein phosphatase 2C domain-containing protein [Candidatus Saccharimonas sp.]